MGGQAPITIVSWNAQGGRGMNVPLVAEALGALAPDILLLQEVQRRQLGALRAALSMADGRWRFKHWPVRVPAEGLGLLARHPVTDVTVQVLAHRWQFWNWRRRIAMHATVRLGDRAVRIVDVHLGAGVAHEERIRQVRALLQRTRGVALVAGDLNAEPHSAELDEFAAAGWMDTEELARGAGTPRPSTNWAQGPRTSAPTQRLDYVLAREPTEVIGAFVPDDWARWAVLSDHLPVVAQLRP
jgi:endonuclease/exonuclease/phosphatase family metal-dependent hydrolase